MTAQWQRIHLQCRRPQFNSWVGKIPWRRDRLPTSVFLGFPCGSAGKESACNVGDLVLIPELERSSRKGKGYPYQYYGLENSWTIGHGVAKSRTTEQISLSQWRESEDQLRAQNHRVRGKPKTSCSWFQVQNAFHNTSRILRSKQVIKGHIIQ